jgi:DNA-binding NarL/FixJ family response regulator
VSPDIEAPPRPLRLLIADDQPIIRRGLAMMLGAEPDIEVVGQAADGIDAIELALRLQPDVVVMDLQMPRASGVVAAREITARLPDSHIVVLTTYDDDDLVFDAICAGARAYLLKDASEAEVLDTVRAVQRGESRMSPAIARKVMEQFRMFAPGRAAASPPMAAVDATTAPDGLDGGKAKAIQSAGPWSSGSPLQEALNDKEERILELIAQGRTNKQIGSAVFLAEGTVKNYVSRIMDKLHARNRAELAAHAVSRRD